MTPAPSPKTAPPTPGDATIEPLIDRHERVTLPRLRRLWDYYRNPAVGRPAQPGSGRPGLAQERGLPPRLLSATPPDQPVRERVIENDIGWRVHTLADFMFAKPVVLQSTAADPARAARIERLLRGVLEHSGGVGLLQDMALLGAVYGFVDVLVRVRPAGSEPGAPTGDPLASRFALELIEPTRAIPALAPDDFRRLRGYLVHVARPTAAPGLLDRLRGRVLGRGDDLPPTGETWTELWTDRGYARFVGRPGRRGRRRIESGVNRLGRVPVVHIQNLPQPFHYEGLSEVEPLIPLQDELNTRLSDRANRVTFQCFKMYLGKGIDGFTDRPIGPGQMWATDNPDASIEAFGGDGENPSEDAHIREVREALDKASAVTPLAAGLIGGRLGNLTSETALRVVLMGLLARTAKKRVTYGAGLARLCELILHAAEVHGILPNRPEERGVRLDWPDPLPDDPAAQLRAAAMKLQLGVPRKQVLAELGYADCPDPEHAPAGGDPPRVTPASPGDAPAPDPSR